MKKDITYQNNAVNCLINHSKYYLSKYDTKNSTIFYAVLQAITGSGKTVIMSKYIEAMSPDSEEGVVDDIAFIWLSVGSGNLHIQSSKKLKKYLPEGTKIMFADEAILNDKLNGGEILMLNWESLNTKKVDKETGNRVFDNIFMRDGDKKNLQMLWQNTRNVGNKIVLIIDESHNTAGSETSREIIDLIDPAFVIELTATPDFSNTNPKGEYEYCTIRASDVIDEEVIKKNIRLNDVNDNVNSEGVLSNLISKAIAKREELKHGYEGEDIKYINPLCLIQLPDGKEGDLLREGVEEIFNNRGISYSNGNLAIWLSEKGNKKNLDGIENINSPIDYLIFKQAIATGWDCPRASILVKLRDIKSEIFDLQTLGRILRMPELSHYNNPILNDGYVFTNAIYTLNTGGYPNVLPLRQVLKEKYKKDVLSLVFDSEVIERIKLTISEKDLICIFNSIINNGGYKFTDDKLEGIFVRSSNVSVSQFHKKSQTDIEYKEASKVFISYSKKDIDRLYKLFVSDIKNDVLSFNFIDNIIISHFKNTIITGDISSIKRVVLSNKNILTEVFNKFKSEINKRRIYTIVHKDFTFERDRHSNEKDMISYKKCAYEKHFVTKYNTEKIFERYLEENNDVLYWIKNGDAGQSSLSIAYNDEGINKGFFPDYVVKFKGGTIGIFEVKDIDDREKETITPKKIAALKNYCNKYEYIGGLIQIDKEEVHQEGLCEKLK